MNQIPDILQIERENRRRARERREREQQVHLDQPEMGDQQDLPPPVPPFNEEREEEQLNNDNGGEFRQPEPNPGGMFRPPQQNRRPIGAYDEPFIREVSLGIIPPTVPANSFELKASILGMVERSTFKGHAAECPLEHLHRFERLCRTFKMSGIPEDTVRMMLFPFSLEDKGAHWEKTIPSNQVATWGNVRTAFLKKFFPKQKTAKFRNEIQSFVQRGDESLSEAWDRLKDYTRSCPHHGFTKENLLGIFYRGVLNEIRRALDTASYGSFASLDGEAAEQLIENMAQSDACFGGDYDRTVRGSSCSVDSKIEKLNERFDKLTKMLMGSQRHVALVDGTYEGYEEEYDNQGVAENQEDVNYVGNQGGYSNFKPFNNTHPNLSYRSTNVENPQDQTYPPKAQGFQPKPFNNSFQQRPQQSFGQARPSFQQQGFQPKGNFQGGFQPRGAGFQAPMPQPSQDPEVKAMFQSIMEGQARGQRENEKKFKEMESQIDQVVFRVKSLEGQVAQVASTSRPAAGTFPGNPVTNPKAPCNAVMESEKMKKDDAEVVEHHESQAKKQPVEDPKEKFRRIVELVEREERLEQEARMAKEEASKPHPTAPLRVLAKREDPGKFNIPVSLGGKVFEDALCDSGSYINLISWDLVQELGLEGMKPHTSPLMFGDASKRVPKGIIKECPIVVGNCIVKSDMLVMDMVNSVRQPILLGAPFLTTAGAVIDYVEEVVVLKHVDEEKRYAIKSPYELCGTIMTKEAPTEFQEVTWVESVPIFAASMFTVETRSEVEAPLKKEAASPDTEEPRVEIEEIKKEKSCEREAPSQKEAASQAEATKAVSFPEIGDYELERLFEDEVPSQKEATSKAAEAKMEVEVKASKAAKPTRKKKPKKVKKAKEDFQEPQPPSIALKPSRIVAGKLECAVKSNGYSKPFAKARIILDSTSKLDLNSSVVSAKMAGLFGIKLDDCGPFKGGSTPQMN